MNKEFEFHKYSVTVVTVFGIIGNILVIISILKQRCLLRNNYYVLVLQLAICDLVVLIILLCDVIVLFWMKEVFYLLFVVAGVGMMLVISVLRYRATVHPLRPAMSRRKLKVICGVVCVVAFILGFVPRNTYDFLYIERIVFYLFPTIFMAVVYYKVGRALLKQSKHMKHLCHADAVRKRHIRDRRTFLICLTTVLCYGIGNLPATAWYIFLFVAKYHSIQVSVWFLSVSRVLNLIGSYAANPVIYGILDKQLRTFWKCRKPNTRRPQERLVQHVGETPL